ncbi:MAG: hypothetical protein ABR549_08435 [Mycobacteriales bacterium]
MTLEEISGGREPRRWLRPGAVVLVLALVAGFAADRLVRDHERRALRRCVVEAESDLDDLAYRTAGLEVYLASAVDRPDIAPSVRSSLKGIVQETVLRGLPPLQRDQTRCTSVRVWHQAARDARRYYVAYLDLRVSQIVRAVKDIDELHVVVPDLLAARARARAALAEVDVRLSP